MNLSPEQVDEIEKALEKLEMLDPAEIPEPAAQLVAILSQLLEETDEP